MDRAVGRRARPGGLRRAGVGDVHRRAAAAVALRRPPFQAQPDGRGPAAASASPPRAMAAFASLSHYRLDVVVAHRGHHRARRARWSCRPPTASSPSWCRPPACRRRWGCSRRRRPAAAWSARRIAGAVLAAVGTGADAVAGRAAAVRRRAARHAPAAARPRGAPPSRAARWSDEFRVGLRVNWAIPIERGWVLCNFVGAVFMVPCVAMLVPAEGAVAGPVRRLAGLVRGRDVAGPAGRLARARRRGGRASQGRFGARVGGAAGDRPGAGAGRLTSDRHVLVACFAVVGVCAATTTLVGKTHRMLARPLAYRARMSAAAIMTMQVSQTLGPAIAGLALTHWSVRTVYVVFGLSSAVSALGFFLDPGLPRLHGAGARRGRRLVRQDVSAGLRGV